MDSSLAQRLYNAYVSHHPEAYWTWDELAPTQHRQWNDVARAAHDILSMPDMSALMPHFGPEHYESEDDA